MKALALLLVAATAHADDHTGTSVSGAPRPGDESGRVDETDDDDTPLRELGRGLLVLPRATFEIAFAPVRAGVWAYERFQLRDRWFQVFFNDDRTVGVYPTLSFDATFGASVGGRFVARDIAGAGEHFALRAATGGRYREIVSAALRSGERLGRVELEVGAEHERRPHDRYYLGDDAIEYRQQLRRASAIADLRVVRDLHLRGAGALAAFTYELPMDQRPVGYDGVRYAYGDLELVWDSRGRQTRWEPGSLATIGWLASAYAGRYAVEDRENFWRLGLDVQHFLRIASGPRVIATRLHVEDVEASGAVPFDELPKLGGPTLLRGYPTDRFRDRLALLGTVEYRWDLAWYLVATTFVDAGRTVGAIGELRKGDTQVGYGIGIEAYTERSFVLRASLATSEDGGVFFNLAFDPAFDLDPRVERR